VRPLALLLIALLAGLLAAPAAAAPPPIGAGAISDILETADVAIDPEAAVTPDERAQLARAAATLRAEGVPVDFVVIREQALGPAAFAEAVQRRLGYRGVQVVVVQNPPSIGYASQHYLYSDPGARAAMETASRRVRTDLVAAAAGLARDVWAAGLAQEAARAERGDGDDDGSAGVVGSLAGFGVLAIFAVVIGLRRRRRGTRRARVHPRTALEPMLDALAARITDLQPRADDHGVGEEVQSAYAEAVIAYGKANEEMPKVATAAQATRVHDAIERGLEAARRAEALLDGKDPDPAPRRRRRRAGGAAG
jgi:hypothetical protein